MHPDDWFAAELERLAAQGLRRALRPVDGPQDARVVLDGRSVLCLSSNNYLGLANHPEVVAAAVAAAERDGVGSGASRLISGSMRAHHLLEAELAAFKGTAASLLFTSGYHANLGVIGSLVGPGDAVFSDALNHASLIDGCRLSRAHVAVYPHADVDGLAARLAAVPARRRLIVTDSVFSMDGDAAPLAAICDLAERYDAMVMVDEAHATGVVGARGAGLVEALGLRGRVTVQMGTLGKALGAFGAYVAGSRPLIDFLVNRARTQIFTTALPPPVVAAARAALAIVGREPARRDAVRHNARRLRAGLQQLGYRVPGDADSHILPVLIGDAEATMACSEALLARGVFAHGIRPPTVPPGTARLRVTVMATHTDADIEAALAAFAAVAAPPAPAARVAR
ncbi:MAG: 8-amino-7-oxononanoate synthase [Deltaproteobacteria bacterium]|nr:8-amino-7-oxononanoate synthase [Deltaproteobacteria bacterium]